MSTNTTFTEYPCVLKLHVALSNTLAVIGLPLNVLLFKVLFSNYRFRQPRHKVLLSLTISDCIQITLLALTLLIGWLADTTTGFVFCHIIRNFVGFYGTVTLIASSGSIIALSIERYIACVHCLRVYDILTDKRVNGALWGIWLLGFCGALSDRSLYEARSTPDMVLSNFTYILFACVIIFTTVCLILTQFKLYLVARRLLRVHPGGSFGSNAEANDFRKSQLKTSIVASAVVMLYVICMCPLGIYLVVLKSKVANISRSFRVAVIFLAQVNTFADPFVYGLGMVDVRRAIIRELRKVKSFLQDTYNNMKCF